MNSSIIIQKILFHSQCGITEVERSQPQPILVDLTLQCHNEAAFESDQLSDTVDYSAITQCIQNHSSNKQYSLLEKLAEDLCQALFQHFPLTRLKIWVRKVRAPMKDFSGTVGIRLIRSRQEILQAQTGTSSPFLVNQLNRLPRGKVLDVATGYGRHAQFLARQGFSVHGIDRNREALDFLETQARIAGGLPITTEYINLEPPDSNPVELGSETYDVILVFYYLYRPLFPQLYEALKPGGVILYETFLLNNHLQRNHPRRKEFCLAPNELLALLHDYQILFYDEGDHQGLSQKDWAFTARALALKP